MFESKFLVLSNLSSGLLDPRAWRTNRLWYSISLRRARGFTFVFQSISSGWHHLRIKALLDLSLRLGWEHFGGKIVCSWDTSLIVHCTLRHRLHICKLGCRTAKAVEWNDRDLLSAAIETCLTNPSWSLWLIQLMLLLVVFGQCRVSQKMSRLSWHSSALGCSLSMGAMLLYAISLIAVKDVDAGPFFDFGTMDFGWSLLCFQV